MNTGWRIRSRKKRHAVLVQHSNDFEFLPNEFLARCEIIRAVALRDFLGESFPCLVFPRFGHVFHARSEEHTSELQSRENLVCRLLLEKKKKKIYQNIPYVDNKASLLIQILVLSHSII